MRALKEKPGAVAAATGQSNQESANKADYSNFPVALTNEEFLQGVFFNLPDAAKPLLAGFSGDPHHQPDQSWRVYPFDGEPLPDCIKNGHNNYFGIFSFYPNGRGAYRRTNQQAALHAVVLDDVGSNGKVDPEAIKLQPSWELETSPDNSQLGFILAEPLTDLGLADLLLHAVKARGLTDSNAADKARLMRLPVGINGKQAVVEDHGSRFPCTLYQWHPERRYSVQQIIRALGLDIDLKSRQGGTESVTDVAPADSGGSDAVLSPKARKIAEDAARRTNEDATIGRHHEIVKMGHFARRDGVQAVELEGMLRLFEQLMRPTDTTGAIKGMDWDKEFKDIRKEYRKPSKPDWPLADEFKDNPPEPADIFAEFPAPAFPLDALPSELRQFAEEQSAQTGFDAGAYAFALIINAANIIDKRTHLFITDSWKVKPHHWGAMIDESGGGKSPVMDRAYSFAEKHYERLLDESIQALQQWQKLKRENPKTDKPQPIFRQRHGKDMTSQSAGLLCNDNPEGIAIYSDELSGWIGSMDAYTGKKGESLDRSVWIDAYNGANTVINRVKYSTPIRVKSFSVGMMGGMQPEKLASAFKQADGSADGLLQRFLIYSMQPSTETDLFASTDQDNEQRLSDLFKVLFSAGEDNYRLSDECRNEFQEFVNASRQLAKNTASARFREHISKFPGFLGRLTLVLHLIEENLRILARPNLNNEIFLMPETEVSLDTLRRAKSILACLYRHSELVYQRIDRQAGSVLELARTAAEAVLSKGWQVFQRGDLTRHATHWQGADHHQCEAALNLLHEFGWIHDITEDKHRRGRRSLGRFSVNPQVHGLFQSQVERIRQQRSARYAALQAVAGAGGR